VSIPVTNANEGFSSGNSFAMSAPAEWIAKDGHGCSRY
jgi:hypothetical protein